MSNLLELIGFALVVAGIYLLAGTGVALIVGGVFVVIIGLAFDGQSIRNWWSTR
jgi:hypothetical protein